MTAETPLFQPPTVAVDTAFERYEAVRARLPHAGFPDVSRRVRDLSDVAGEFDVFILDAFGVLNVGDSAIPGAVGRIADLRAAGKRLFVLTNAASYARETALAKYRRFGFDFRPEDVVSSRDVTAAGIVAFPQVSLWGAASGPGADFSDLSGPIEDLEADPSLFERAEGFLLLSSSGWTPERHAALIAALKARPRPLLVGNPDLVAPRESGLTLEPGWWAHDIADRTGIEPAFFGKPYANAFAAIRARCPELDRLRVAMVGDTLHTDILGGRAAGFSGILIADHGLFAGRDLADYVARSGIVPDIVCRTT
jgi:HAD superfamily hydrolase (TIGR01450 family)